jgi:F0F1-type ATP synthase assembly protein I
MAESPDEKRGLPPPVTKETVDLGRYTGLGLQFAASLALFGAIGWWIDRRLSTRPWIFILGLFLGAALAFVSLLRAVPPSGRGNHPPTDSP